MAGSPVSELGRWPAECRGVSTFATSLQERWARSNSPKSRLLLPATEVWPSVELTLRPDDAESSHEPCQVGGMRAHLIRPSAGSCGLRARDLGVPTDETSHSFARAAFVGVKLARQYFPSNVDQTQTEQRRRKGHFTAEQWARQEADIIAAGREGRILGGLSLDGR